LEEALETLATYSQLCNVLLAVVSDLSNESISMASTAQHSSDLSANALPHIKEMLRNSHMMEYTSGPKHQEIVESVMISKSHYDLSIALFQAVEEHASIMQRMKQPGGVGVPDIGMRSTIGGGMGYADSHGHTARQRRREEEGGNDSSDDEDYSFAPTVSGRGSSGRTPVPPGSKKDSSTLFRGGAKDSPKQKQLREGKIRKKGST
jgi:hypothetical protein